MVGLIPFTLRFAAVVEVWNRLAYGNHTFHSLHFNKDGNQTLMRYLVSIRNLVFELYEY